MLIAFASSDGITVNQHFGWSKSFELYRITEDSAEFVKTLDSSQDAIEDEHEKLAYKISTVKEADIMYCSQIGPTASKMVLASKIYPMRSGENDRIDETIVKLQELLLGNPPPWLQRIVHTSKDNNAI
ncbi:NifB/NifX family molybdenum-iron cluster-binding protein [Sulfuricurvum sp.]|uniref:NifB/NifX family molybdenum-iron cluster-binding protein n=1 Tax=Sulfuricurvum sp. TaxID=2025608 RepID=UPI0026243593|nr:NifB/NifX family molybdenum-iron cluster-binding protein [Sulfuricurvum sp.]MDD2266835.1 NifB/NifX family molybdenum-iron cluster-binding protein [Sulfuricurvum sp.]MDD2783860.1 NifB/NifX family molybdenum-iron cluster-binding protein [Sulfuricurvum sp.]MDD5117554.1 NifB/NifX family molybdenum-iron cluster-binding protein [Sulfuricurvum sp.]HZF69954.1 NifB/NifX family molybdenum-iron cluster-binding protein [Sulfuricurvum sp.]